jgi:excisionase family DNA binding protein
VRAIIEQLLPELKRHLSAELGVLATLPEIRPAARQQEVRLSTTEAANVACVARKTLVAWIRSGRLAAIRPPGTRQYLIRRADLEEFLSAGCPTKQGRSRDDEERVRRALGL